MRKNTDDHTDFKYIFILRHALALPSSPAIKDIDRSLAPQGLEDANALGKYMTSRHYTPETAFCSTAKRTRQTLDQVLKSQAIQQISYEPTLYSGKLDDYLSLLQNIQADVRSVLVVAHNPTIYELAVFLCGQGIESHMQRLSEGYKPATLSVLRFSNRTWENLKAKCCELIDICDPLDYNAPQRPTRWM